MRDAVIIQISSHRRSGTHALIDFIRSRYVIHGSFFHLEDIIALSINQLRDKNVIVKTHEPEPNQKLTRFLKEGRLTKDKFEEINAITIDIHAYRNPKDALRSLYYFNLKGHEPVYRIPHAMPFIDFLKQKGVQDAAPGENRVAFWQRCVQNWTSHKGVLSCEYSTIAFKPKELESAVSQHCNIPAANRTYENHGSTAIGRGTTQSFATTDIWSPECKEFLMSNLDTQFLSSLGLEI